MVDTCKKYVSIVEWLTDWKDLVLLQHLHCLAHFAPRADYWVEQQHLGVVLTVYQMYLDLLGKAEAPGFGFISHLGQS